jgi:hypothetical protein
MKVMGANGLMVPPDSRAAVSTTKEPLALQPAAGRILPREDAAGYSGQTPWTTAGASHFQWRD